MINEDGITHINIYSKGKTPLGQFLSNFAECNLEIEDGKFKSIEGYWYWLSCKNDRLRNLSGHEAKVFGKQAGGIDWLDTPVFKKKICKAISYKLENMTPELKTEFLNCNLPFVHYYVFGVKAVEPKEGAWIIRHIDNERIRMLNNLTF